MINVLNINALKSHYSGPVALSELQLGGYMGEVDRLPVDVAYREVGWYRRGLDLRANGVAMMPFDVLDGEKVVFDEQSNDVDLPEVLNIFTLIGQLVRDFDRHGAAYAVFETDVFGYKKEWRRLHPASIAPRFSSNGELLYFDRTYGVRRDSKYRYEPDELLWLWMPPDHTENMPGAGVGYTALLAATGMANKGKFEAYFFERGAINPTLVKVKGFATMPKDEKDRVTNVFQKMMAGMRNAFKITPIDGDVEVFNLMSSLKDMTLDKMTVQQREEIGTTLGIPLSMLMSNAANYATAVQDDFHFYDKTIVPLCREILAPQLNKQLFKRAGLKLEYVKKRLEVYQKMESEKAYALAPLFDRKIVSANQVLRHLDMEEFEQDWYKDTSGVTEISVSGEGNQISIGSDAEGRAAIREEVREQKALTPSPSPSGRGELLQSGEQMASENISYPVLDDVEKWERMALKRWDEGKQDKALEFVSDVIPAGLRGAIKGGLESAQTVDDVKLVFADAVKYVNH